MMARPSSHLRNNRAPERRVQAEKRGRRGEWLAALWLQVRGYRIFAKRVKTPVGEIDLIAGRGNLLVFIEVKVRRTRSDALHALSAQQRHRIERAATFYLGRNPQLAGRDVRFDLMVMGSGIPHHVVDAWRPDG